jgi:cellulose 1,4-beta-cellobiosidase
LIVNAETPNPQPSEKPGVPTGVEAKLEVKLSWNSIPSATSYNVKRALSEAGPYTTIASDLKTTSYIDTNVVSGVAYYYVISFVNAAGESANSAPVTALKHSTATMQ